MKLCVSKTLSIAMLSSLALVTNPLLADNDEDEVFVYSNQTNEAMATCLIDVDDSSSALATCLCQASSNQFAFCAASTVTTVEDAVALGFGDAFSLAETSLSANVLTSGYESDIRIEVNASCTLKQGELVLQAVDTGPAIDFILGEISRYGAIYMWPEVDGAPVADPIKLCARRSESLIVDTASATNTTTSAIDGVPTIDLEITHDDISMAGGFQWVAEDVVAGNHTVAVKFIVVAGVDNYLLQALSTDAVAVGVLAEAKLEDRIMHVVGYENLTIVNSQTRSVTAGGDRSRGQDWSTRGSGHPLPTKESERGGR